MKRKTLDSISRGNVWRLRAVTDAFPTVRTFEDAERPMVMVVKPEDIARAVRKAPSKCAFACAARSTGFTGAYIARSVAYFIKGSRAIRYKPSAKAFAEVRAFDIAGTFEPSAYSFRPYEKLKRFGAKHQPKLKHQMKSPAKRKEIAKDNHMRKGKPADYVRVFGS